MVSYFEPNFIEKFLWESGFQILAKIEMTQNENRLFDRHFETVRQFKYLSGMGFDSAYINGANFIAKFRWENGFLPLGTNGSKSTLVTLVLMVDESYKLIKKLYTFNVVLLGRDLLKLILTNSSM